MLFLLRETGSWNTKKTLQPFHGIDVKRNHSNRFDKYDYQYCANTGKLMFLHSKLFLWRAFSNDRGTLSDMKHSTSLLFIRSTVQGNLVPLAYLYNLVLLFNVLWPLIFVPSFHPTSHIQIKCLLSLLQIIFESSRSAHPSRHTTLFCLRIVHQRPWLNDMDHFLRRSEQCTRWRLFYSSKCALEAMKLHGVAATPPPLTSWK